jgi:hypothetical protein
MSKNLRDIGDFFMVYRTVHPEDYYLIQLLNHRYHFNTQDKKVYYYLEHQVFLSLVEDVPNESLEPANYNIYVNKYNQISAEIKQEKRFQVSARFIVNLLHVFLFKPKVELRICPSTLYVMTFTIRDVFPIGLLIAKRLSNRKFKELIYEKLANDKIDYINFENLEHVVLCAYYCRFIKTTGRESLLYLRLLHFYKGLNYKSPWIIPEPKLPSKYLSKEQNKLGKTFHILVKV